MKLVWLPRAAEQREAAIEYIVTAALEQLDRIEHATSRLLDYPKLGKPGRVKGTRELVIPKTSFILVYQLRGQEVLVLRVLHGRMEFL